MKTPQHRQRKTALARRTPNGVAGLARRSPKGVAGLALRSARREAGFTLIEMLAVVAVMGIMLGAAVIGFNAFGRGARLRTAGRLIVQQLDLARQRALTFRCMYGVEFEPRAKKRDRLRVYYEDQDSNKTTVGRWTELPPGIEFGAAPPPEGTDLPPGDDGIQFRPSGSAEGSSFTFKIHDEETDKERTIEVVPITGHAKVSTD